MDIPSLIRKVIKSLNNSKHKFEAASSHDEKKKEYNTFIKGIEDLHKIYKSQSNQTSAQALQKIKEILTSALKDANEMKMGMQNAPKHQSHHNKKSNNSKPNHGNKSDHGDKDQNSRDNAMSGAIVTTKPNVKWEDVAGLENAKKSLQEAIILPTKFPDIFVGLRQPWKGILLYGPPGTGKTFLAKACATQADATFFSVSSSDLISKYVGESAKSIKTLFEMARSYKQSIIFIDEIDSLVSARSENENEASKRVKTEFLVQMQGVGNSDQGILVLGATNLPWTLDSAVRRRFQKRIYIPLPDFDARLYLIKHKMKKNKHIIREEDFREVAKLCDGYSGSDINGLVKNACYEPLRKFQNTKFFKQVGTNSKGQPMWMPCSPSEPGATKIDKTKLTGDNIQNNPIDKMDFLKALNTTRPSVGKEDLKRYDEWTNTYGMKGE